MSDVDRWSALFDDYARGRITPAQLRQLNAALAEHADVRREFIEYLNLDSALADLAADPDDLTANAPTSQEQQRTVVQWAGEECPAARPRLRATLSVAAVAVVLFLGVVVWRPASQSNPVPTPTLASIVEQVDAELAKDEELWANERLTSGRYRLDQGLLQLKFANNVAVYFEAPAKFELVDPQRLRLLSGRVSATVPPEGVGFTVETAEAQIVDYGTEFSVEAESGASEVHVFSGLVRVHTRHSAPDEAEAVDLRTAEAVRIDESVPAPFPIQLAPDRFIRTFDESKLAYARMMRLLAPAVYYRMPIRRRGLVAEPSQYSGQVLTGNGVYPPHAPGAFSGASLRVQAGSKGRGGRVDTQPPLQSGQATWTTLLYLDSRPPGGTVVTNLLGDQGNFSLSLDQQGRLQATVRTQTGKLQYLVCETLLPLAKWFQVIVTADGRQLQIYVNGQLSASVPCGSVANNGAGSLWFGTAADATGLWDGRIDELAIFDRSLSLDEIAALYQAEQ